MRIYLQALDCEIQEIVSDGPFMPTIKNKEREEIPKYSNEWGKVEKKKTSISFKAMNALFYDQIRGSFIEFQVIPMHMKFRGS